MYVQCHTYEIWGNSTSQNLLDDVVLSNNAYLSKHCPTSFGQWSFPKSHNAATWLKQAKTVDLKLLKSVDIYSHMREGR